MNLYKYLLLFIAIPIYIHTADDRAQIKWIRCDNRWVRQDTKKEVLLHPQELQQRLTNIKMNPESIPFAAAMIDIIVDYQKEEPQEIAAALKQGHARYMFHTCRYISSCKEWFIRHQIIEDRGTIFAILLKDNPAVLTELTKIGCLSPTA